MDQPTIWLTCRQQRTNLQATIWPSNKLTNDKPIDPLLGPLMKQWGDHLIGWLMPNEQTTNQYIKCKRAGEDQTLCYMTENQCQSNLNEPFTTFSNSRRKINLSIRNFRRVWHFECEKLNVAAHMNSFLWNNINVSDWTIIQPLMKTSSCFLCFLSGINQGSCYRINHFPDDNDYDTDSSEYLLRKCSSLLFFFFVWRR